MKENLQQTTGLLTDTMNRKLKTAFILASILLFLSTEAHAKKNKRKKLEQPHTIIFHDNCPKTTAALREEVSLKATIPGYRGTVSVSYMLWPEEQHAYPITEYYGCCDRIRKSMEKDSGKTVKLSFNTKEDQTGTNLNLYSAQTAAETAIFLIENKITDVYAFYTIEEPEKTETPEDSEMENQ